NGKLIKRTLSLCERLTSLHFNSAFRQNQQFRHTQDISPILAPVFLRRHLLRVALARGSAAECDGAIPVERRSLSMTYEYSDAEATGRRPEGVTHVSFSHFRREQD